MHLSGYLTQLAAGQAADPAVLGAFAELVAAVPRDGFETATADRRALVALVEAGRIDEARQLAVAAAAARSSRQFDAAGLRAWAEALVALDESGAGGLDVGALLVDGPLTALANDAALAEVAALETTVTALAATASVTALDGSTVESVILRWMLSAVRSGEAAAVRRVSLVRRAVPLVVDTVDATPSTLALSGPLPWPEGVEGASLALQGETETSLDLVVDGDRWHARISTNDLPAPGRYAVVVRFTAGPSIESQDHAVVTARMPLPPLPADHELQPLSDRARGWVFLVDRRAPALRGLLGRVASRLRR
ncbi:hypothetical protein GCM10025867_37870 [Frondihabitans sucicola]|uniref:Uncharacterized protein n=1 Tax=Frondihabitans sucicola TaxID=1268041 RepID=A0ABN6Y393_9MICO|nr:hypothetical protein GCM10025867_37870 [Frondihabitans sucicola]